MVSYYSYLLGVREVVEVTFNRGRAASSWNTYRHSTVKTSSGERTRFCHLAVVPDLGSVALACRAACVFRTCVIVLLRLNCSWLMKGTGEVHLPCFHLCSSGFSLVCVNNGLNFASPPQSRAVCGYFLCLIPSSWGLLLLNVHFIVCYFTMEAKSS